MDTAVQLYTLRNVEEPTAQLIDRVGETPLDGVEFAAAPTEEGVAEALTENDLTATAAHVPDDRIERSTEEIVEACDRVNCATVVVPYLDESHFNDRAAVAETADRLETLAELLEPHGMRLCYHNHDHEFISPRETEGSSAFELLVEETDDAVGFELDVGWVTAGGYDPEELLQRFGDRIPLVHLSDVDEDGEPTEVGEGVVDVPAVVDAARDAGVETIIYEYDDPEDPFESLAHGATVLMDPHQAR